MLECGDSLRATEIFPFFYLPEALIYTHTPTHVHTEPVTETTALRNFLWSCNTLVLFSQTDAADKLRNAKSFLRPKHHLEDKSLPSARFSFEMRSNCM